VKSSRRVAQDARFRLFIDGVMVRKYAILAGRRNTLQIGHVRVSEAEIRS
jgi:hypothetical protein